VTQDVTFDQLGFMAINLEIFFLETTLLSQSLAMEVTKFIIDIQFVYQSLQTMFFSALMAPIV